MVEIADPIKFGKLCWPHVTFYKEQEEIIYSVCDNVETVVPAGNKLGKDFVAGFLILWFFLTRNPCRIVTTSATEDHLEVVWGELTNFIQTSKYPMTVDKGGPLIVNRRKIRKIVGGEECCLSYIDRKVAAPDNVEGLQGHHIAGIGDGIPRTLFVPDECSGILEAYYTMAQGWFDRMLAIGNPWPCDNFFKYAVKGRPGTKDKGGDIKALGNGHFHRKVIQIKAQYSPNVMLGMAQVKAGKEPTHEMLVPGVKTYREYLMNREMWTPIQQCVALDAEWYEGAEVKMYPPIWLNKAQVLAVEGVARRGDKVMGVDTAQGGDNTAWAIGDDAGLIALRSMKTPDTSKIPGKTLAFALEYGVDPKNILFDAGGGGQQHVDYMRSQGHKVRAVAFGGAASPEKKRGRTLLDQRKEQDEVRYIYKNRRAEMYNLLRLKIDPANEGWAMPAEIINEPRSDGGPSLREQLSHIPLDYDGEGRLVMLPKTKQDPNSEKRCLVDIIGCSPDEADAAVLLAFGLQERTTVFLAEPMF